MLSGQAFQRYQQPTQAIQEAMDIYHNIHDTKNHVTMTALMKVLLHFNEPHRVHPVWNDVIETPNISYPLLLKCCVLCKPDEFHISKCIESLSRMNAAQYKLREYESQDFSRTLCKLITKCTVFSELQSIQTLIHRYHDIYNQTALITAYGKLSQHAHALESAHTVFQSLDKTQIRTVTVSAMMTACINHHQSVQALRLYDEYNQHSFLDDVAHKIALRACMNVNNISKGYEIANKVHNHDHKELQLTLLEFYGHAQDIRAAIDVFDSVPEKQKHVRLIGCMMRILVCNNQYQAALALYDKYTPFHFNNVTDLFAIKACKGLNDYQRGTEIHAQILKQNKFDTKYISMELQTTLINFYGHFRQFAEIEKIFASMTRVSADTINAHMTAYINDLRFADALRVYEDAVQTDRTLQNQVTHMLAIKACTNIGDFKRGKEIHQRLIREHQQLHVKVKNTLIDFYGKFGDIVEAQNMFDQHRNKDVVSLNNMMRAYIKIGEYQKALNMYDEYAEQNTVDEISHLFAIQACAATKNKTKGMEIGEKIPKDKAQCANLLIDFYGSFGDVQSAEQLFASLAQSKTTVSINSMMKVYINNERADRALKLYEQYKALVDDISHVLAIKACTNTGDFAAGKQICDGLPVQSTRNANVKHSMIDFYGSFNDVETALEIFDSIENEDKDIVCINAMMQVYYMNEMFAECIRLFENMKAINQGLQADLISYAILLKVCTESMSFEYGQRIHEHLKTHHSDFIQETQIQSNLIDMYGKMGQLETCREIFAEIEHNESDKYRTELDIWNTMINAYGHNRELQAVQELMEKMKSLKMEMNRKMYISLINVYSHIGDVKCALNLWQNDIANIAVKYDACVVTSMVDCLARSGKLNEAKQLIGEYEKYSENEYYAEMWSCLLNGCWKYINAQNKRFAEHIYQEIYRRFREDKKRMQSVQIIMSNIRNHSVCSR